MPRLRVLAGPSPDKLELIEANTSKAYPIATERFEGEVAVHIKGLVDENGEAHNGPYFQRPERSGVTWSIQVRGRFLQAISADDVLFGNTFDRALKLPWGTSAVLRFMNYIDPTLEHDLYSEHPWALSPLISTMPYLAHSKYPSHNTFPPPEPLEEDASSLAPHLNITNNRRTVFASAEKRQELELTPNDVITTDFCYGFISFPGLTLNLPGGLSFSLIQYWDGQPVRFVCCERKSDGTGGPGEPFWCVVFEVAEEDSDVDFSSDEKSLKEKGRAPSAVNSDID